MALTFSWLRAYGEARLNKNAIGGWRLVHLQFGIAIMGWAVNFAVCAALMPARLV